MSRNRYSVHYETRPEWMTIEEPSALILHLIWMILSLTQHWLICAEAIPESGLTESLKDNFCILNAATILWVFSLYKMNFATSGYSWIFGSFSWSVSRCTCICGMFCNIRSSWVYYGVVSMMDFPGEYKLHHSKWEDMCSGSWEFLSEKVVGRERLIKIEWILDFWCCAAEYSIHSI